MKKSIAKTQVSHEFDNTHPKPKICNCNLLVPPFEKPCKERQTDRETDTQTDRQTDRQTDMTVIDRRTDRQRDRQTAS